MLFVSRMMCLPCKTGFFRSPMSSKYWRSPVEATDRSHPSFGKVMMNAAQSITVWDLYNTNSDPQNIFQKKRFAIHFQLSHVMLSSFVIFYNYICKIMKADFFKVFFPITTLMETPNVYSPYKNTYFIVRFSCQSRKSISCALTESIYIPKS